MAEATTPVPDEVINAGDPSDDTFSPEEQAYFNSRGKEGPAVDPVPDPVPSPAVDPAAVEPPAAAAADDDADDGEDEPAQPAVDPKTGKQPPRRVNYNKFKKLEERYQESERERANLREMTARYDERMKIIDEALKAPAAAEAKPAEPDDPMPDPKEDIFAWTEWKTRNDAREIAALREQLTREQSERTQSAEQTQLLTSYAQDAQRFVRSGTEDADKFGFAYQHIMGMRDRQLAAGGMTDAAARAAWIKQEEMALVAQAYEQKVNPAQRIWDIAIQSGFDPKKVIPAAPAAAGAPEGTAPAKPAAAATPAPAPAAPGPGGKPSVEAEIAAILRGQEASTSLSNAGGAPMPQMTMETLANMPDEDFGVLMSKLTKAQQRKIMSGGALQ